MPKKNKQKSSKFQKNKLSSRKLRKNQQARTKLEDYANMSIHRMTNMDTSDLKSVYSYMRKIYKQRARRFEQSGFTFRFSSDINSVISLHDNRTMIMKGIQELQDLILNPRTTLQGYRELEYAKKPTFENRWLKRKFKDDEEYWAFRRFLDSMASKYGIQWAKISGDVIETIDKQFMPNIDPDNEKGIHPSRIWDNFTFFMQEEKEGKAKWETIKEGYELAIKQGRRIVDRFSREELRSLGLPTLKEWEEMFDKD